jgi:hypothetical protein
MVRLTLATVPQVMEGKEMRCDETPNHQYGSEPTHRESREKVPSPTRDRARGWPLRLAAGLTRH